MRFEDLVKRLSPKLKAIAKKLDGRFSFFDEEDLYQEALIYLWKKWKKGQTYGKTESFILQGCFFFLKNYLRKICKKIDFNSVSLNGFVQEGERVLEKTLFLEDGEEDFNAVEINLLLEGIQRRLTERERKVFFLYGEGFTTREIGKKVGVSHVMVIKIKNRIREKCREFKKEIV